MSTVYSHYGAANLIDQHRLALGALQANDADGLRRAIASDIADGMGLIGRSRL
jgi:DNA-binding GntR family transcriptional regulator